MLIMKFIKNLFNSFFFVIILIFLCISSNLFSLENKLTEEDKKTVKQLKKRYFTKRIIYSYYITTDENIPNTKQELLRNENRIDFFIKTACENSINLTNTLECLVVNFDKILLNNLSIFYYEPMPDPETGEEKELNDDLKKIVLGNIGGKKYYSIGSFYVYTDKNTNKRFLSVRTAGADLKLYLEILNDNQYKLIKATARF